MKTFSVVATSLLVIGVAYFTVYGNPGYRVVSRAEADSCVGAGLCYESKILASCNTPSYGSCNSTLCTAGSGGNPDVCPTGTKEVTYDHGSYGSACSAGDYGYWTCQNLGAYCYILYNCFGCQTITDPSGVLLSVCKGGTFDQVNYKPDWTPLGYGCSSGYGA